MHVLFELVWIARLLYDCDTPPRWVNINRHHWEETFVMWAMEGFHYWPAQQGAQRWAASKNFFLAKVQIGALPQEATGTTVGILVAIMHFTYPKSNRWKKQGSTERGRLVRIQVLNLMLLKV
jgi:hypothetical protein